LGHDAAAQPLHRSRRTRCAGIWHRAAFPRLAPAHGEPGLEILRRPPRLPRRSLRYCARALLGALSDAHPLEGGDRVAREQGQGMKLFRRDGKRPMPLSERLYRRFLLKYHGRYLVADLQARAKARSLDYIEAHMRDALLFEDRWDLLLFAAGRAPAEGMMLEFGVADGA